MKKLLCSMLVLSVMVACQKKQYFTSSPEIDLVKKANEAYFKGDWETLKSVYADTAKAWFNTWHTKSDGLTPDQLIESFKAGVAPYAEVKMEENPVYEMIVTDDGFKWVHCWLLWTAKTKDGKVASVPVNLSCMVVNNKVVYQGLVADTLPGYLATHPSDSTQVAP